MADELVERVLADIASMMSQHVENWPYPRKIDTAIALISKTLDAALTNAVPRDVAESWKAKAENLSAARKEAATTITRLTEANAAQARRWSLIDQLRDGEGHSVEIIHDNPDFGGPNCSVRTTTDYGMNYAVFFGETVDACLEAAVAARALTGGQP